MKTTQLIDVLARQAGPAPTAVVARRLAPALAVGLLLGVAGALFVLGPIPMALYADPGPWIKFAYAGGLAAASAWWVSRLARPVARTAWPRRAALGVIAAMAALGLAVWWAAPPDLRHAVLMGHSWSSCPTSVAALSLPAMAALMWALRGLAPTRPRAAGAAAGLLAGAVGALGYTLACDELSPTFVAVWYTAGIVAVTALGALLGPRLLRW